MDESNRGVVERYWRALQEGDMGALADVYQEDAIQEWPQSGERIIGSANIVAISESYPSMPKVTIRRIIGNGDLWIAEATLEYGDEAYEAVSVLEMRDGKIAKETDFFAASFDAPEWRAQWVERM